MTALIGIVLLAGLAFLNQISAGGPFEHYYCTYLMSLAAGHSNRISFRNAFFSQIPDTDKDFEAIKHLMDDVIGIGGHALAGNKCIGVPVCDNSIMPEVSAADETNYYTKILGAAESGSPLFGIALHPWADSYFHRVKDNPSALYGNLIGHSIFPGVDDAETRPPLFMTYMSDLFDILVEKRAADAPERWNKEKDVTDYVNTLMGLGAHDHDAMIVNIIAKIQEAITAYDNVDPTIVPYDPKETGREFYENMRLPGTHWIDPDELSPGQVREWFTTWEAATYGEAKTEKDAQKKNENRRAEDIQRQVNADPSNRPPPELIQISNADIPAYPTASDPRLSGHHRLSRFSKLKKKIPS